MKTLTLVFLSLGFAVFTTAQSLLPVPSGGTVYASGLEGPRGLKVRSRPLKPIPQKNQSEAGLPPGISRRPPGNRSEYLKEKRV